MATLEIALQVEISFVSEAAMHRSSRHSRLLICSAALLLVSACSGKEEAAREQYSDAAETPPHALGTEPWVNDVQVGAAAGAASSASQGLTPGTELELSMSVDHAPQGTVVTAYWYGPQDRQLAYESKTVEPQQRQMNFTQENTHDWPAGTYRAEIWAEGAKVQEQNFQIVSGRPAA